MKGILLGLCAAVLLGIGIYIFVAVTGDESDTVEASNVQGIVVCLPLLVAESAELPTCELGLQTDDENDSPVFFALDTRALDEEVMRQFDTGDMVSVSGEIIPRQTLAEGDRLLAYDIAGIITAENLSVLSQNGQTVGEDSMASSTLHVMKGGDLQFEVPDNFGLAITREQILVQSYIPPCGDNFDYCVYYNANEYADTNFDSAGLRIEERPGLIEEAENGEACLATPPEGYTTITPNIETKDGYSISRFVGLGDAGAGHFAEGELYRLYFEGSCFEFETRIAQSQFGNYEAGAIEEFTDNKKEEMQQFLYAILKSVRFVGREDEQIFDKSTLEPNI